jgi:hypothetical protein
MARWEDEHVQRVGVDRRQRPLQRGRRCARFNLL